MQHMEQICHWRKRAMQTACMATIQLEPGVARTGWLCAPQPASIFNPTTSHACRTALRAAITLWTKGAASHQRRCALSKACRTRAAADTTPGTVSRVLGGPKTASAVVLRTLTKCQYASGVVAGGSERRPVQLSAKVSCCHLHTLVPKLNRALEAGFPGGTKAGRVCKQSRTG